MYRVFYGCQTLQKCQALSAYDRFGDSSLRSGIRVNKWEKEEKVRPGHWWLTRRSLSGKQMAKLSEPEACAG
jgi:hypothetical protein